MKCPHCLESFHSDPRFLEIGDDGEGRWSLEIELCPACHRFVLTLIRQSVIPRGALTSREEKEWLVWPRAASRPPVPKEVPPEFAEDYVEACRVLPESPKASAALSRRCLQHLLREVAKVRPGNLADEIQEILDRQILPSYLADSLDSVRVIGNFAAHPVKSTNSGEVIPVEPGEAEWTLDVLESLFDFFFVQPEKLKRKKSALDAKLKEAGKPPMK